MSIWDKMNALTQGKIIEEKEKLESDSIAKHGDIIEGVITNVIKGNEKKNGGYGFITSPSLPFERIFFHWTGLRQDTLRFPEIRKRMKVEFQLQNDKFNGFRAIKIKVIQ